MSGRVFHAPFVNLHPGFNLYGVFERSKKTVTQFYPAVKSFDTLEEMLADETIELVIVNTPNASHYEYAKKALEAGKHVIVEKPFVTDSREGEELIKLASKQQKKIAVYHNRRWDSDYQIIKQAVDEKWLGEIVEAEFHFDRFKEELNPKAHKEVPGPGTGALFDLGSHLLDQALYLFGKPEAVFGDIYIMRPISQVDDYFELLLYYQGKRVRLKGSYQAREPFPSFVLHGTKGSFLKTRSDIQEGELQAGKIPTGENWGVDPESEKGLLHTERNGEIIREHIASPKGNYMAYFEGVYQAIRFGKPVPVTAEDGLEVVKVIEAAFKSSHQRRVVEY
jgi:predicted dehydrogenase